MPYDGPAEEADAARRARAGDGQRRAWCARIEILGQAIVDIRQQTVADPRLVLEVAVVRLARREARTSVETLLERVERLGTRSSRPAARPRRSHRAAGCPRRRAAPQPRRRAERGADARAASRAPKPKRDRQPRRNPAGRAPQPNRVADRQPRRPTSFDPDDVIEAWPAVLEALKAPLRAAIQHAQPIGVEEGVVVFGVPRQRFDAINGRFRSEADAIKDAFAAQLGFQPRFMLRPHDFDAPDALRPVGDASAAVAAPRRCRRRPTTKRRST